MGELEVRGMNIVDGEGGCYPAPSSQIAPHSIRSKQWSIKADWWIGAVVSNNDGRMSVLDKFSST